ncbi:hypothetical protein AAC387_Pa03g3825 [Persea americana]
MSFSATVVNRLLTCVTSVTYRVMVNGRVSDIIWPSQGLRQGYPLFPYLFIICGEALARDALNEDKKRASNYTRSFFNHNVDNGSLINSGESLHSSIASRPQGGNRISTPTDDASSSSSNYQAALASGNMFSSFRNILLSFYFLLHLLSFYLLL